MWYSLFCSGLKLLPFCTPCKHSGRREKQEVKEAGEVVFVSLLNATEAQSVGGLTLRPKPELVRKIAAMGAA